MKSAHDFYAERDRRTREYSGTDQLNRVPVEVCIDPATAASPEGQFLLLALANQLARVHRRIWFVVPAGSIPLRANVPFGKATLSESLIKTASAIDPFGNFSVEDRQVIGEKFSIGIGLNPGSCQWYLGAHGAIGILSKEPTLVDFSRQGTLLGAAASSCLGASAVFRYEIGRRITARTLSAWNFAEGAAAALGPDRIPLVDVGRVLMVGAGAVGSALAYWLAAFGVSGPWTILDKDKVALHNTNRGLLFLPAHSGWLNGEVQHKADVLAGFLPNSEPVREWFHDWPGGSQKFDVILALANEFDVRSALASRNAALVLHATTGQYWLSEAHRHILGRDDCIRCRTLDIRTPTLGCSEDEIQSEAGKPSFDAALPFLSAASGLMLASLLQRLQTGVLASGRHNNWQWYFDSERHMARARIWQCRDCCSVVHPAPLRERLNAGSRWAHLDSNR